MSVAYLRAAVNTVAIRDEPGSVDRIGDFGKGDAVRLVAPVGCALPEWVEVDMVGAVREPAEEGRERPATGFVRTRNRVCALLEPWADGAAAAAAHAAQAAERDGGTSWFRSGRDKSDSTSLQRECSARARSGKSIHASRPFREMIARPKISRNEWKTAERGAFEVGNVALLSCPGSGPRRARRRRRRSTRGPCSRAASRSTSSASASTSRPGSSSRRAPLLLPFRTTSPRSRRTSRTPSATRPGSSPTSRRSTWCTRS